MRWAVAPLLGEASAGTLPPGTRDDVAALLTDYQAWLTANADRAEALVELAGLRRAAGDPAAARGAFERALRRDDTSIVAMLNFADDLRADGDDPRAETLLRKALALYPESADAHFALGMLLVRRQEVMAGVSELGRANELAPDNSQYAYAYGVGLHSTRQDERALATLSGARTRFPDNAPIAGGAAGALRRRERPGPRSPLPVTGMRTGDGDREDGGRSDVPHPCWSSPRGHHHRCVDRPSWGTAAETRPPSRDVSYTAKDVKAFASLERGAWQKPGEVVSLLQLWPGNVVADIGAGTGPLAPFWRTRSAQPAACWRWASSRRRR